jgi:hypothetical protein
MALSVSVKRKACDELTDEPVAHKRIRNNEGQPVQQVLTRRATLAEIRARFSENTLPRNAHPRDDNIKLDTSWDKEKNRRKHDYYLRNADGEWELKKGTVSASGFGGYWTWPFVEDRVAAVCANARNNARKKELDRELTEAETTTVAMILDEWKQTAEYGTQMHALYDKLLNGEMLTDDEEAALHPAFLDAMAAHPTWVPYRTEWSVYDIELDVIGQLDCIMYDTATGEYILVDWKHWKIDTSEEKHGGVWHPLFAGLDDTKVNKARFQTNVYRMAVERNYGISPTKIYVFSFPPEDVNKFEEHVIPLVDLLAGFALLPWKWNDVRHLGPGTLACERVFDEVDGPTRVVGWQTFTPLPDEDYVWISNKWSRCDCGQGHKGVALNRCTKKDVDFAVSEWRFNHYPRGVYGKARYTEDELHIAQVMYERQLLMQPATLLRGWEQLYGKVLLCWPSEVDGHAAVLARYVNALGSGKIALKEAPPVITIDEFYKPAAPPLLSCPDCRSWAPAQVDCDARASCVSWNCEACTGKRVTKKILKLY